MAYRSYRNLEVWKKAMQLADCAYSFTDGLPDSERYKLISQIERSAVSISSNIAEGQGRGTHGEIRQFTRIALGSLAELETQVLLACKRHSLPEPTVLFDLSEQVGKMLTKLHLSISEEPATYNAESDLPLQTLNSKL